MKRIFLFLGILIFLVISLNAQNNTAKEVKTKKTQIIKITPELRKKYPIKEHHKKLSFDCVFCHSNQGTDPEKFEYIGSEGCLSCHGSKLKIAQRTGYMDAYHTNPHNSFHDGPTLDCDECHQVHEPSKNMCKECHEKEIPSWMKDVTP